MNLIRCLKIGFLIIALTLSSPPSVLSAASPGSQANYCLFLPLVRTSPPVTVVDHGPLALKNFTLHVLGEVAATSDQPVVDVVVEVKVYDYQDQLLGSFSDSTYLTATLPGQLNPFDILTNVDTEFGRYEVDIKSWSREGEQHYAPATVVLARAVPSASYITTIYVEARNDTSWPLVDVKGVAWDIGPGGGGPVGVTAVSDYLAPGATTAFTTTMAARSDLPPGSDPLAGVRISVQGTIAETETIGPD